MALPDRDRAGDWGGMTVVDRAGSTLGTCTQIWTDDATGLPEWATVRLGDLVTVVPLVDAVEDGDRVRVTVSRDEALLAPPVADDHHLSQDDEARLYRHYGIQVSRDGSPSLLPVGEGRPILAGVPAASGNGTRPASDDARPAVPDGRPVADRPWLWWGATAVGAAVAVLAGVAALRGRRRTPVAVGGGS